MPDSFNQELKKDRIGIFIISISIIILSIFFLKKDNSINESNLTELQLTLKESPKFIERQGKTPAHIIITSKEYKKDFHISNFEYKTIDLELFKKSINKNDSIRIKIDNSDKYKLNRETIVNNFTYVYGLEKNNSQFIDLEKTKKLKDEDTKIAFFILGLGLIMLPYAFIRRNVELRFEMMILTYIFLSAIIYSILKANKLI